MIRKLFLLYLLLLVAFSNVMSQNSFRSGFAISLKNDTIYGNIEIKAKSRNYKSLILSIDGKKIEYSPDDVIGYGVPDEFYYTSQVVKSEFIEALILGDISLYKSEKNFILEKGREVHKITIEDIEVKVDGQTKLKENNRWRGILTYMLSDCIKQPMNKVQRLSPSEKSLSRVVVDYNKCSGNEYLEIKGKKPWFKMGYGVVPAIQYSEIRINEGLTNPALNSQYSSFDPSIGILVRMFSPRVNERITFNAEIHYYKSIYSSYFITSGSVTEHYDTYIQLNTIFFPLSLGYAIPLKNLDLEIQGGINFDLHLDSETRLSKETVIGTTVNTDPVVSLFEIRKNQVGIFGGIGLTYRFDKFNSSGLFRYTYLPDFNETIGLSSSLGRFSFHLIISK